MWNEITYPFPNFNSCTVEVWKWISNFIPHYTMDIITYPCWDLSQSMLVKGATGQHWFQVMAWCCQATRHHLTNVDLSSARLQGMNSGKTYASYQSEKLKTIFLEMQYLSPGISELTCLHPLGGMVQAVDGQDGSWWEQALWYADFPDTWIHHPIEGGWTARATCCDLTCLPWTSWIVGLKRK